MKANQSNKSLIAKLVLGLISLFMLIPIIIVMRSWFEPMAEVWSHLADYVLPSVLKNSALILVLVTVIAGSLGTYLAWLTSMYRFTGQKFFAWALMLPFAIPAYVLAFVSVGIFDYSGILQSSLRELGINGSFIQIRNVWGAGVILSLVFYPYVYLLARQAFLSQGQRALEAGQMLGLTRQQAFFKVALPQAMPWIVGGLLLTWMETLADFGAVSVFNLDTFTTAIYKAWFGFFSLTTAAQLAALLIVAVFIVLLFERYWQKKRSYLPSAGSRQRQQLSGLKNLWALLFCSLIFILAFGIPMGQLLIWVIDNYHIDLDNRYWGFVTNTLLIASATAVTIAVLALLMAWLLRQFPSRSNQLLVSLANLGYAVPGTVLAVGVFIPIASMDNALIALNITTTQVISGSVVVMLLALTTRFVTVGFQPIDRQLNRLTPSQEQAAQLLTTNRWQRWRQVYLPVISPGVLTALIMVFVEVTKEMPITLMTRRQGWDTLAVRVFEMTSEGMYERAALPSLTIVLVGLIPVILLIRQSDKS
ncbi:ABC transporter permease [Psychrobacter sp. FDAARGOS_221]|uniref:ABC transporter permease n=1 Tax=Psychrobacter sp. FDAARGOS_221 TaxID=1975705 RepID=UPI000BB57416|nr:iron ABC transporter permease [Psychrobacter sp. FDAARGOS_221]PNK61632.1 iron ABC transporter permease [Psychrobacter sp. FDAARGOS_221]